jgi:hypothetical protein
MRGDDIHQDTMFSYLSPGAQGPSPAAAAADGEPGLAGAFPGLCCHVLPGGTPLHPTGEAAPGFAPPGVVHHPQRTAADGAIGLQSPVSLVCGPVPGRQGLEPFRLLQDRERFLASDLAAAFFLRIKEQAAAAGLLSDEHFTVDGTLIEAWASLKSFRPKDTPPPEGGGGRNPEVDFHGEKRLNQTHASTTDPEARLGKRGGQALSRRQKQ